MNRRPVLAAALLACSACADIPKDPDGTLEHIRAQHSFRVGLIATGDAGLDRPATAALLANLVRATGAQPKIETGAAEDLLLRLEHGDLDLVVGRFTPATPWAKRVTISPPLAHRIGNFGRIQVAAATANGENAWITLVHRAAVEVAAAAARPAP